MLKSRLIKLYGERMKEISIRDGKQLCNLLDRDEKLFYFYLMRAYLTNEDLSKVLKGVPKSVYSAIELFCLRAEADGRHDIVRYFNKYISEKEVYNQIGRIQKELDLLV